VANADPSLVVRNRLNGSSSLVTDTNLFAGPIRPSPLAGVWCLATGGLAPEPFLGVDKDFRQKTVQVRVRSNPGDFAGGETLAVACFERLHKHIPSGWIDLLVREPWPTYIGQDANECHEWSLNVDCRIVESTA
jgi:hypothetical protein